MRRSAGSAISFLTALAAAALAIGSPGAAQAQPPLRDLRTLSADLCVTLADQPLGKFKDAEGASQLELVVPCAAGRIEGDFYAVTTVPSRSHVWGKITEASVQADAIRVSVSLMLSPRYGVPASPADITLDLRPTADGRSLEGTYASAFMGKKYSGKATALAIPAAVPLPGFTPVAPSEHPRLLFRGSQVEALRAKAATPEGRRIVARLQQLLEQAQKTGGSLANYAVGHAILYTLNGDARSAQVAQQVLKDFFEVQLNPEGDKRSRNWFETAQPVHDAALTYDLCFDAWDANFRGIIALQIYNRAQWMTQPGGKGYEGDPASAWQAVSRGAGGMAALAVLNDPLIWRPVDEALSAPPPPTPPPAADAPLSLENARVVNPPANFEPGRGVPVAPFESDVTPGKWLMAGPFPRPTDLLSPNTRGGGEEQDLLASLGGPERARPESDTLVNYRDISRRFQPLDSRYFISTKYTAGRNAIDVTEIVRRVPGSVVFFYTVIQNDRPRLVKLTGGGTSWLAGQRVGGTVRINPGYYPILVQTSVGKMQHPWSTSQVSPRLVEQVIEPPAPPPATTQSTTAPSPRTPDLSLARAARVADFSVRRWVLLADRRGALLNLDDDATQSLAGGVFPYALAARNVLGQDVLAATAAPAAVPWASARAWSGYGAELLFATGGNAVRRDALLLPALAAYPDALSTTTARRAGGGTLASKRPADALNALLALP